MIDLLFICQGNIARSQIAEGFAKKYYPNLKIESCGIDDVGHKYNYKCYLPAIEKMKKFGIDISSQRPKVINENFVKQAKKIIIFCKQQECNNGFPEYLKKAKNVKYFYVGDPNNKKEDFLENVIGEIEKIVKNLF